MTPHQLFEWASENIPSIPFEYCSLRDYEIEERSFQERFARSRTIPGTRKYHSFVPISKNKIRMKVFSASSTSTEERVCSEDDDVHVESIAGFVTCVFEGKWWLARVLRIPSSENQVELTLLHSAGPSSFKFLTTEHIIAVPRKDILLVVDPRTRTGRVYTLTKKEIRMTSDKLLRKNPV